MLILAHLLNSISIVLSYILSTLIVLVIARVILSWVNPDPYNPIVRFIYSVSDSLLSLVAPVGKYINPRGSPLDLVPWFLLLFLIFLQSFLVPLLHDYALALRV